MMNQHIEIQPAILYLGTPVVLITTENEDGSTNISPMSSAWWLASSCMLGLMNSSQTTQNLLRTKQCVLNLPDQSLAWAVDRLALTTGSNPVPIDKVEMGVKYVADKFNHAGLQAMPSLSVKPLRIKQCPIQLEAVLNANHDYGVDDPRTGTGLQALEVRIDKVHILPSLRAANAANRIDPDKWRPLIMNFRQYYGLGDQLQPSRLSEFPEDFYTAPWLR